MAGGRVRESSWGMDPPSVLRGSGGGSRLGEHLRYGPAESYAVRGMPAGRREGRESRRFVAGSRLSFYRWSIIRQVAPRAAIRCDSPRYAARAHATLGASVVLGKHAAQSGIVAWHTATTCVSRRCHMPQRSGMVPTKKLSVPVAAVDKEVYSSEMDFKGISSQGATTAVVFRFIHYTPSP